MPAKIVKMKCNQCGRKVDISYTGKKPNGEYEQFHFNKKLEATYIIDSQLSEGDDVTQVLKSTVLDEAHAECSHCEDEVFAEFTLNDGTITEDVEEVIKKII